MELEKIVANLVQKVERRFYGKYRGFVVDNADPEHLGRLKLTVPSVFGKDVVTGWATPCVPYGGEANLGFLFIPPKKNTGVWVEFEEGDIEFPVWVGTFWSKPEGKSELPKPNKDDGTEEGDVQDPPTRKIIKTEKGHTIQFEDADGEEMVIIVEAKNDHVVKMDKAGIKITDGANKHKIVLDSAGVTISDNPGNEIKMDSQGITLSDKNGSTITMNALSGFVGPGVDLNGGTRVCLEGLIDWLLGHQHIGNLGAPTPLFPANIPQLSLAKAAPGSLILSDTVKVK